MINKLQAIISLMPSAEVSVINNEIIWHKPASPAFTEAEIDAEVARLVAQQPFDDCKAKAKQLIAACDWSALPDVALANQADFIAYRAALRALIINPVADPVWPTEPTPDWG